MKQYLATKDYFLTQESFELVLDENLDMLVTKPQPPELSKYYESENYISHTDGSKHLMDKIYRVAKKINLKNKLNLISKFVESEKSILDVGAGTGDFLQLAKQHDWNIIGVEPNRHARQLALKKNIEWKSELTAIDGRKFELITLWHVLEHLPDLEVNIATFSRLLNDTGTLVIAVPNFKSHDAKHYQQFWAAYDTPRHLWHFSKRAIKKLFAVHDLELIKVSPMWFDAYYVSLLSESYKTGRRNWFKAFLVGSWSNFKGLYTKEYSSHIYFLKKVK